MQYYPSSKRSYFEGGSLQSKERGSESQPGSKQRKHPCNKMSEMMKVAGTKLPPSIIISNMKPISLFPFTAGTKLIRSCKSSQILSLSSKSFLHTSPPKTATVAPITASGPPPTAPTPSAEHVDCRVARRRKQAELLKRGQDLRAVAGGTGGGTASSKRFWSHVFVKHANGIISSLSRLFRSLLH